MNLHFLLILLLLLCPRGAAAQHDRTGHTPEAQAGQPEKHAFRISHAPAAQAIDLNAATILYDTTEAAVVGHAARMLADDIGRVTGRRPSVAPTASKGTSVIIGTLGKSRLVSEIVRRKRLAVDALRGQWERFYIAAVDRPLPGLDRAIVIIGSDRRGTAYGALSLSEAIGVSPWYWWADVPVVRRPQLYAQVPQPWISPAPSVKFRGIFINDEDWGLQPWAAKNYEPTLGDIGPKTYAAVCELLLRLKGNMLAPAMHACSAPFYSQPENQRVADEYGILVTTSHCEPLLFNNASVLEWDPQRDGAWNYLTNAATIRRKLDARVAEAAPYENIYTLALRGLHDAGMQGDLTPAERLQLLTRAIGDQRDILRKHLTQPLDAVPQIFVPYKEALDVYELGLPLPDEVTIVWPDDNYGYIKRLSTPAEQARTGRSGVYYHTSYLGTPHDYLWLNTTPPVLMYEELKKAYDTGADRYWLLNVGDIKPMELAITTFFDMAYSLGSHTYDSVHRHQANFLAAIFGSSHTAELQAILDEYYRLAWSRKPEYMGWEREWDTPRWTPLQDTDFSFAHYNDARGRLADYERLRQRVTTLQAALPADVRPAFFELVAYPVLASEQMNRKFLLAQLNHELARSGDKAGANWAAAQSVEAFEAIESLNTTFNRLLDGKWNHFMSVPPGFVAKYHEMPPLTTFDGVAPRRVDLTPQPAQNVLDRCTVVDLNRVSRLQTNGTHAVRLLRGIGYDWVGLQMGEATQPATDPTSPRSPCAEYTFTATGADSVTISLYVLPFWPLNKERGTKLGVSVDGGAVAVVENELVEWAPLWKEQVLQNSAVYRLRFPLSSSASHTLRLICGDPGAIIQRIVVDWGGLQPSYVGPSMRLAAARQ